MRGAVPPLPQYVLMARRSFNHRDSFNILPLQTGGRNEVTCDMGAEYCNVVNGSKTFPKSSGSSQNGRRNFDARQIIPRLASWKCCVLNLKNLPRKPEETTRKTKAMMVEN
jgi:hypothetical protein